MDPSDSAFPNSTKMGEMKITEGGLTKREYIATSILSAMLSRPIMFVTNADSTADTLRSNMVRDSLKATDELIKQLNNKGEQK